MTRFKGRCPKCGTWIIATPKIVTWRDLWELFKKRVKLSLKKA
jgi:hypothetical protein